MKISPITAKATATATAQPRETDGSDTTTKSPQDSPFIFDQTPVTKPATPKGDGPARFGAALLRR